MHPFVRQCGIEIYRNKSLTKGGIFLPKDKQYKKYTPEFTIKVMEPMREEKLSYNETAREFNVSSDTVVKKWERIYLEEGNEGFYVQRQGRKSAGRPQK